MHTRFLHTADIHLGNHQYQSDARYNDFGQAFIQVVDDAIARQVDVVLIAGDLFHKRAIDALTLYQAQSSLGRLRAANIPALLIEGNHDRAFYRDVGVSWLSFLAWTNGTILLEPKIVEGQVHFPPWDPEARSGGYYDVPGRGIRVYGLPWYGASTGALIQRVAEELTARREDESAQGVRYRMMMLHTGVEGMVPTVHGLPTRQAFEPLRGLVDYIALGHVHMPYALDDWIYNPGSLETVSAEEWAWPDRGYYLVEVDPEGPSHRAELIPTPRRRFVRERFRVDGIGSPEDMAARFDGFCMRRLGGATDEPVVDITLAGTLAFDPGALDRRALEAIVRRHCQPLVVNLRNHTQSLEFDPATGDLDGRDRSTRQELELTVFRDLVLRDARFAPEADAWAKTLTELKQHALNGDDPETIAAWLAAKRREIAASEETAF